MSKTASSQPIIRDLGDGLVLRRSAPADTKALIDFNMQVHNPPHIPGLNHRIGIWVRDLMDGRLPGFTPHDFTIVEDIRTGKIVSSINLISQTWSYGGVEFPLGRPELVGTLPEYRRKGLVRAQFDLIHQWSAQRGELALAITGIPWFYRQFGYEMALELDGGYDIPVSRIPALPKGNKESFRFRPAKLDDIPFLTRTYAQGLEQYLVACPRTKELWRYELTGQRPGNFQLMRYIIIETAAGAPVGFLSHYDVLWGDYLGLPAPLFMLKPKTNWLEPTYAALRFLQKSGQRLAKKSGGNFNTIGLSLGSDHPIYHVIPDLLGKKQNSYAYYMRVPDLPRFIRHIKPVLEQRLAASLLCGHSGELNISFYRENLRLVFRRGRLTKVDNKPSDICNAAFPNHSFLQVLFGYRSPDELNRIYPDCRFHNNDAKVLLNILFPKAPSAIRALA